MKKCPFCGGIPSLMEGTKFSKIECSRCGCRTNYCFSAKEAIDIWDSRYESDPSEGENGTWAYCYKSTGPYPDIAINDTGAEAIKED